MRTIRKTACVIAMMVALPMGSALACTVTNWDDGPTTAQDTDTGTPLDGVARYSGECALSTDSKVVVKNNAATSTYRARFYVLPGVETGTVTIFKAASGQDGNGAPVVTVAYDGPETAFNFEQNGTPVGSPVTGIAPGNWYGVEVFYQAGEHFSAWVVGKGDDDELGNVDVSSNIGSGEVQSAALGIIDNTADQAFNFDAFESTKSKDQDIGWLCQGDSNNDNTIDVFDRGTINQELAQIKIATGQPDCNEDGVIDVFDRGCINAMLAFNIDCAQN